MIHLLSAIQNGTQVTFRYKLTDRKGSVLFENMAGKPTSYIHGGGTISPELEKNMAGLRPGDVKSFVLPGDFSANESYTIEVVIDSVEDIHEIVNTECGKNCNC